MKKLHTLSFYNVENLFDTQDDPTTLDDDFVPNGKKRWTLKRYENKLGKLAKTISEIGKEKTGHSPSLVGLAEVENKVVLKDLLNIHHLRDEGYDFVHFDSEDERGIDVALLYKTADFTPIYATAIEPPEFIHKNEIDYTRDILYVHGKLHEHEMHLFVVHLPSKRNQDINKPKREAIAQVVKNKIKELYENYDNPYIVVMGDFNDGPSSSTLKKYFKATPSPFDLKDRALFNPLEVFAKDGKGTLVHKGEWYLYDHLLFSQAFLNQFATPNLVDAQIFSPLFLQEWNKKYEGQPFRTFVGRKYLGGYSDHFPVYAVLRF